MAGVTDRIIWGTAFFLVNILWLQDFDRFSHAAREANQESVMMIGASLALWALYFGILDFHFRVCEFLLNKLAVLFFLDFCEVVHLRRTKKRT